MMAPGKPQYSMRIKKYRLTTNITTSLECPQIKWNASEKEEKLNSAKSSSHINLSWLIVWISVSFNLWSESPRLYYKNTTFSCVIVMVINNLDVGHRLVWHVRVLPFLWQQRWISSSFQLNAGISKRLDGPNNVRPQELHKLQHL